MPSVSITELKAHLAEYLRRTESGERFFITVRGKEVAELKPPDPERVALWDMVRSGEAEWGGDYMIVPFDLPKCPTSSWRTADHIPTNRIRSANDHLPRHQRIREARHR